MDLSNLDSTAWDRRGSFGNDILQMTLELKRGSTDAPRFVFGGVPGARDADEVFALVSEAVTWQLGIRVEPRKVSVQNFVIDNVDRPTQ